MRIDLTTDNYPEDVSWEVLKKDGNNMVLVEDSSGESYAPRKKYMTDICLSSCEATEYVFNIYDSWGDGLTDGSDGMFMVFLGEDRIMGRSDGKDYEGSDSVKIFLNNTCRPRDTALDTLRIDLSHITPSTDLGEDKMDGHAEGPSKEPIVKPGNPEPKAKKTKSEKGRLRFRKTM